MYKSYIKVSINSFSDALNLGVLIESDLRFHKYLLHYIQTVYFAIKFN